MESAARAPDDRSIRTPHFADGRWLVARPIVSRTAPTAILGWLAAAKSLSGPASAQVAKPLWAFDAARLPKELLAPAKPTGQGFAITTHLSPDEAFGYAALRDGGGKTVWVLRLARASVDGGSGMGYVFAALLVLLAAAVGTLLVFRRHVHRQKSVDARYKALIDQANDGIVIVDAHTHQVLYTNPAFLEPPRLYRRGSAVA